MNRFRGLVTATGYLIDPRILSQENLRRRVREHWLEGARLVTVDGCYLLALPGPVSIRAEHAPGLPLTGPDGVLTVVRHGRAAQFVVQDLPVADLAGVVDIDAFRLHVLDPAPSTPIDAPALIEADTAAPRPDLRRDARIGPATGRLGRGRRELQETIESAPETGLAPAPRRARVAELLWRSPVRGILGRRHARYVDGLTRSFEKQDWDTALRSAISVAGGSGALSLRLPKPRPSVHGPLGRPASSEGSIPYGPTVQAHLRSLYLDAAEQLARDGQVMRAAFVHADLLGNPLNAVELLERLGATESTAKLAEGWNLDPGLVVRLWWRAGDRDRAVRIARVRGAFATAIERLRQLDPEAARVLRREWVAERREAGDPLGAVQAAWPDPSLHDLVDSDIARGVASGGSLSGTLLAYLLNSRGSDDAAQAARRLLTDADPSAGPARAAFLRALVKLPAADPAHDRELTSLALLDTFAEASVSSPVAVRDARRSLRPRADPLLVADLPRGPATRPSPSPRPLLVEARDGGLIPVCDAVAVGPDSILVALGELGVQLMAHDGAVRARWDVPAHAIVIADHGTRAVFAGRRPGVHVLHQLDLPISRPVPLPTLRAHVLLDGYDGTRLVTAGPDGLSWLYPVAGRWRIGWTELTETPVAIHMVTRSPDSMAALFVDRHTQAWRWDLPSLMLRQRDTVGDPPPDLLLATGQQGWLLSTEAGHKVAWQPPTQGQAMEADPRVLGGGRVRAMGNGYALTSQDEENCTLSVFPTLGPPALARVEFQAGQDPRARIFNDLVTVIAPTGRILVFDHSRDELVADVLSRI